MVVVVTIIFALLFLVPAQPKDLRCFLDGACQGMELEGASADSHSACLDFCQADPACHWITWYSDLDICVSFSSCQNINASITATVSSQRDCSGEPCFFEGHCQGKFVDVSHEADAKACLGKCKATAGCEWFSYDSEGSICFALDHCDTVEECTTCQSGKKDCKIPEGFDILLMAGGDDYEGVEFVGLTDGVCEDFSPPDLIINSEGFGEFVHGRPILCNMDEQKCFELTGDEWDQFAEFEQSYYGTGRVVLPNGDLWVTGGTDGQETTR